LHATIDLSKWWLATSSRVVPLPQNLIPLAAKVCFPRCPSPRPQGESLAPKGLSQLTGLLFA
jgi:hypothetical protein